MYERIRHAYELGKRGARLDTGTWATLAGLIATSATSAAVAAATWPGSESRFMETPIPVADWAMPWTSTMQPPAIEQASQLEALRYVAGGASALLAGLCFLVVAALWGQRLRLRRDENFMHWAVGADRWHVLARVAGEGRFWLLGSITSALVAITLWAALMTSTFPGEITLPVGARAALIVLTGIVAALVRWERLAASGPIRMSGFPAYELLGSPTTMGAVGIAILCGVGLLVLHAPYARPTSQPDGMIVDVAVVLPSEGARRRQIRDLIESLSTGGERPGIASAGTVRGAGHREAASTECGQCSEGGIPMPVKYVSAEVFAVAQDTFAHLGIQVTRGRDFDDSRDGGPPSVAIVSEALAGRHFERGEAIGKRIRVGHGDWLTVVGVVEDAIDVATTTEYAIYVPVTQVAPTAIELIVPPSRDADDVASRVAAAGGVASAWHERAQAFAVQRWFRGFMWVVGGAAMLVLALGLWIAAANEARATRFEIGLRRAVGARRRSLQRLYAGLLAWRLSRAIVIGAWLSLFLGAGLGRAYGAIPQVDGLVLALAGSWVSIFYILGSCGPFMSACRAPLLEGLNAA